MALDLEDIAGRPALHRFVRAQSQALLQTYESSPRLASVFATQQRWLMAHIGLALHFRQEPHDDRTGLTAARFIDMIRRHSVASREGSRQADRRPVRRRRREQARDRSVMQRMPIRSGSKTGSATRTAILRRARTAAAIRLEP